MDNNKNLMQELLENDYTFLDGAMGTMLQSAGLKLGERPEVLCITEPDTVKDVHRKYFESGSDIIYANTFGANAHKLEGTGHTVAEVVSAAVKLALEVRDEAITHATKGSCISDNRYAACDSGADGPDTDCRTGDFRDNRAGERGAKDAHATKRYVALDIGPIGEMLEPYGTLSFEKAYDIYKEMILAGSAAGADLVIFETMTDLYEVKAGVLAAKENCELPVFVTMSFEARGRTFTGTSVESMACVLEGLGTDAVGINCSLGPEEIYPIAKRLSASTTLPIIIKANAGLPDPETGKYNVSASDFAASMKKFADLGMRFVGGCCGTDPAYISETVKALAGLAPARERRVPHVSKVCTPTQVVDIDRVRVIGERINPTGKKRFKQALLENDIDYILHQGIEQMEAGASILDVNVGLPDINEPEMMVKVVKALQSVVDIPLQIDSSDPAAIEAGLRVCNGKPIVNSVNGEPDVMKKIFPLVKKYGAAVVGLTLDKRGIPQKAEERFEIAKRIVQTAATYGIPKEDVFIDCLTLTVSAEQAGARETLKAVRMCKEDLGVHTVLGVSNISFGLPYRELINHSFLTLAMGAGLDLPIINPNVESMINAVMAYNVLDNVDRDSAAYIEKFANYAPIASAVKAGAAASGAGYVADGSASGRDGKATGSCASGIVGTGAASPTVGLAAGFTTDAATSVAGNAAAAGPGASDAAQGGAADAHAINHAIEKGLKEEAARAVESLAASVGEMDIINDYLIPALDEVGARFEAGRIFLPQLLNSAAAASAAFEVIKKRLAKSSAQSVSKGKIIVATVKGDIHDIGKNIVKVILENYGYTVIDLGKDVDPELVVQTAIAEDVKLVGLSALMTTTLVSMEDTIKALRTSGHECKIMVGGAVLTPDYAEKMGADFYAKDAKESADIAKKVLG